jgi:hypothetical protein
VGGAEQAEGVIQGSEEAFVAALQTTAGLFIAQLMPVPFPQATCCCQGLNESGDPHYLAFFVQQQ